MPLRTNSHAAQAATDGGKKLGLTTAEAERLYEEVGFNELPHIQVSLGWMFLSQFTGVMPYTLEFACVLALAVQSYADFAIIAAILLTNGVVGFTEELKAKRSLDALTEKMEQKIPCIRDGAATQLLTRLLVPGDIVLLTGGAAVPADVEWLEGDVLSVDTAALTGEPLSRKYPSDEYGSLILCGATIVAGEAYCIVRATGVHTEIGGSQAAIMEDKAAAHVSLFERRVLLAVKIIGALAMVDVLIIFLVQGIGRHEFTAGAAKIRELLTSCMSIIIASMPVALPLVLQVTMALGAGKMAREFNAVVTSLPALQDISSMSVLCSDKTGTLTTAKISIHGESIWAAPGFAAEDVALYALLASNRDKKEDPIDRAVTTFFDRTASATMKQSTQAFAVTRSVGFNPAYKRVLYEYRHPELGVVAVAKGLANKVADTSDGGQDDALDQWRVEHCDTLLREIARRDSALSKAGYKTLGVAVKIGERSAFRFVGILPMIDPPRHDTPQTIRRLRHAGVSVKMITGDHQNIAIETARLIGLGVNILRGEEIRASSHTHTRDELVLNADGFAQVLPRDKREIVLVLKNTFKKVVGMTGDGVNDAPALSAAQCGIAVDDATDAAKNAATIILTTPGLSAIYMAIVESRRIFRKLKAYIIYRFAATVQIVTVLTLLIYISECKINSLMIILLALLNDLTLLPIAYDRQAVSAAPDYPSVTNMLVTAASLGVLQTALSLLYAYAAEDTRWFRSEVDIFQCSKAAQAGVWVQITMSCELLIFSVRAPSFFLLSHHPSYALLSSVSLGCLAVSAIACAANYFGSLYVQDVAIIWAYDVICLFVVDAAKVALFDLLGERTEVLEELEETPPTIVDERKAAREAAQALFDIESRGAKQKVLFDSEEKEGEGLEEEEMEAEESSSKSKASMSRLGRWYSSSSPVSAYTVAPPSTVAPEERDRGSSPPIRLVRRPSHTAIIAAKRSSSAIAAMGRPSEADSSTDSTVVDGNISFSGNYPTQGSTIDLRISSSASDLRPYTPANLSARLKKTKQEEK